MTSRRNQLLAKLIKGATGESEAKLYQLTIERICADMCEYFAKFYENEGPGAMVFIPTAKDEKDSMFYLNLNCLMNALNDLNNRDIEGAADVMKRAIARAEQIDPMKESLFIIQDDDAMSLVHMKHDQEGASFKYM
tara:strand:+ start:1238 stop:1645 length:408 start_codon:yes stop_codon:yes gene_type:complete